MERKNILEFLESQFKKLKEEEHVKDLSENGRVDELKQVVEKLDFSMLDEFFDNGGNFLDLTADELPLSYLDEIIFYFTHCRINKERLFRKVKDRKEVLEFLPIEIKRLKEEHVEDLMRNNQVDKLKELAKGLDFSILDKFFDNGGCFLDLTEDEIPIEDCFYELVFYFMHSKYNDEKLFKPEGLITFWLYGKKDELAIKLKNYLSWLELTDIKIEELLLVEWRDCQERKLLQWGFFG